MATKDNRNPTKNSREDLAGLQLFRSPSGWWAESQPEHGTARAGLLRLHHPLSGQPHMPSRSGCSSASSSPLFLCLGWELLGHSIEINPAIENPGYCMYVPTGIQAGLGASSGSFVRACQR